MPRKSRQASREDSESEKEPADVSHPVRPTDILADSDSDNSTEAAINPSTRRVNRREVFADVARNRAGFFARGAGAGSDQRGGERGGEEKGGEERAGGERRGPLRRREERAGGERGGGERAGEERGGAQWPGPFSTARSLLRGRDSAKAAREDGAAATGQHTEGGTADIVKDAWYIPGLLGDDTAEAKLLRGIDLTGIDPADFQPQWVPSGGMQLPGATVVDVASPVAGVKRKRDANNSKEDAAAAAANMNADTERRIRAIAGPSGVRLQVPPLTVLCMEALLQYLPQIPAPPIPGLKVKEDGSVAAASGIFVQKTLEPEVMGPVATEHTYEDFGLDCLMPDVRNKFCMAACRARAMDNHTFALLTFNCAESLHVPDCAGVDENTLLKCLSVTRGLRSLRLGHCGRGFTDRVAEALVKSGCLVSLTDLEIAGAFVLTDSGMVNLVRACPELKRLALKQCPLLTGEFIEQAAHPLDGFDARLVVLEELVLEKLPMVDDATLLGAPSTASTQVRQSEGQKKSASKRLRTSDLVPDTLPQDAEDAEELCIQAAIAASLEAPVELVPQQHGPETISGHIDHEGGVLRLAKSLRALRLHNLDKVTDAMLSRLAGESTAKATPVWQSFGVIDCPLVKEDGVCAVLARQGKSLQELRLSGDGFTARTLWTIAATVSDTLRDLALPRCAELGRYPASWSGPSAEVLLIKVLQTAGPSLHTLDVSSLPCLRGSVLVACGRYCKNLRTLDISFCRAVNDAAVGFLCDSCANLTKLTVWGCTQLTEYFYYGHAKASRGYDGPPLRIYGKPGDIMAAPEYD